MVIKKCFSCGAVVRVLHDCECEGCGIRCCDKEMQELVPNSVDASFEKHVPTYEIKEEKILVSVNHVMEEDHYIEWICVVSGNKEVITYFEPGDECSIQCKYIPGSVIYAYCNKHGLWKAETK